VHDLPPLSVRQVVGSANSRLWNEYIARYHYLGHTPMAGSQSRYFVFAGETLVALLSFGASAWKLAAREQFIGWHDEQRQRNLQLVVNNARFLILPWIQCQGLASKILSLIQRQTAQGLAGALRLPPRAARNLRRDASPSRHLLPGRQLDQGRSNRRARQEVPHQQADPPDQGHLALPPSPILPISPLPLIRLANGAGALRVGRILTSDRLGRKSGRYRQTGPIRLGHASGLRRPRLS
jgi:hypothetical protein